MTNLIQRKISGKTILVLFILTNVVYVSMLVITIPMVSAFADGLKLLDMMPTGYDFSYVEHLFDTLGEEGRNAYLTRQLPLDMIYPGLFAISYSLVMVFFLNKLGKLNGFFGVLVILPIIGGLADYLENIGIITMLLRYPDFTATMVELTATASLLKSMTTTAFFVSLIIVLVIFGIKKIRKR